MPTNPSYQDGVTAFGALSATCLNTGVIYLCFDGSPAAGSVTKEFSDNVGAPLGSDTRIGFVKGTLNLMLKQATDALPKPGYIILFNGGYYIAGTVTPKIVSLTEVRFSVAIINAINPVITNLLSAAGQSFAAAWTHSVVIAPINCAAVNVAVGALAWAISAGPAGVVIDAATGIITGTPTALTAGSYTIVVTCTDTAGRVGQGFITAVVA